MRRLDWNQVRAYWRDDRARAGDVDETSDPDALGNVCHAGAPAWFNEYYARHQRAVFAGLLQAVPMPASARALDVGCGAGRWCRALAARGYTVHGIDLQDRLIARNRVRYPEMTFECVPVQDLVSQPFDLVTSITVIQHVPFEDQGAVLTKISALVKPGGHALVLENIADQGAHVFANSIASWTRGFDAAGFSLLRLQRYDYSPVIRLSSALVAAAGNVGRRLGLMPAPVGAAAPRAPKAAGMSEGGGVRRAARGLGWALRRAAVAVDDQIEPGLIRLNVELPTIHCGFLFQKRA